MLETHYLKRITEALERIANAAERQADSGVRRGPWMKRPEPAPADPIVVPVEVYPTVCASCGQGTGHAAECRFA